ncbi:MAG TPA: thioredoxin domain-containing protein [Solirubrobacterales bacterium]|nr:thioredoxin domain-containing protein [Solirubrobacterales bacterium]
MPNRLSDETSPYLLQHKDNPVDWYPWGEEALTRAKSEDKPLLVSIGYSACHWCHVMEHESFEDAETAAILNASFVPVKVDREERPDVDTIYMGAVQAMTGHGGWPLNVFVDPEGVPFFGGTYFPPEPRHGMPSFRQVLEGVAEAWRDRREEIRAAAAQTVESLNAGARLRPTDEEPSPQELEEAEHSLGAQFDPNFGGFGGAPKFPPASALEFLMARIADGAANSEKATEMVRTTLIRMARGGIYDQVGGGFARYSVDAHWLVPHFEKMLYDNALLARAYLHAWQLTGDDLFRRVCEETLDWALREMRGPEGGFYSALDADSEGEEGRFYVWSEQELRAVLGDDAEPLLSYWGADRGPNFEGRSILYVEGEAIDPEVLARGRQRLYEVRAQRVWPGLDDKRLTAWNALMLAALADAGAVLERADYLDAARQCAEFLLGQMRGADGRLLRTYKDGRASLAAYLEDHAFLSEALLVLYEATLETRWFTAARGLADDIVTRFRDPDAGGFFDTASDHEALVVRPRSFEDHPIPAGSSAAALALLRIFAVTGERAYERPAIEVFRLLHKAVARHPQAFGHLLQAMHLHFATPREVALVGEQVEPLARVVRRRLHPTVVVAGMRPGDEEAAAAIPLLRGRDLVDGNPAAYVCENFACRMPVTDPAELEQLLA